jgi:hypothetical protein
MRQESQSGRDIMSLWFYRFWLCVVVSRPGSKSVATAVIYFPTTPANQAELAAKGCFRASSHVAAPRFTWSVATKKWATKGKV